MYIKKIIASVALIATVAVSASMFAAHQGNIVNVTAKIENALAVSPLEIEFGTVYPNMYYEESLDIGMSASFLADPSVHDIIYRIVQKPKPLEKGLLLEDVGMNNAIIKVEDATNKFIAGDNIIIGFHLPNTETRTISTISGNEITLGSVLGNNHVVGEWVATVDVYPDLCPYLSKHPDKPQCSDGIDNDGDGLIDFGSDSLNDPDCSSLDDDNEAEAGYQEDKDEGVSVPHPPCEGSSCAIARGYLDKDVNDEDDAWTIDLKVPPFWGMYAQGNCSDGIDNDNDGLTDCDLTASSNQCGPGADPECCNGGGCCHPDWDETWGGAVPPMLDPASNGTTFGCDLWVEVLEISEYYCGDGMITGDEECEENTDCDNYNNNGCYECVDCMCVPITDGL